MVTILIDICNNLDSKAPQNEVLSVILCDDAVMMI